MSRSSLPESSRRRGGRCPARIDVVHDRDTRRRSRGRYERPEHISAACGKREAALPWNSARPNEQRFDRQLPASAELDRERGGRVVATLKHPISVGGDRGEDVHRRGRDQLQHEIGGKCGESSQATLLPTPHKCSDGRVVDDGGPGRGERESPSRALAAADYRPRGRGPAARAKRRTETRKLIAAGGADRRAGDCTHQAALRQEQVQEVHFRDRSGQTGRGRCRRVSVV
jgi:hypothetical protein